MTSRYICILCEDELVYDDEVKTFVHKSSGGVIAHEPNKHLAVPRRAGCYEEIRNDREDD